MGNYENLKVWQKAINLTKEVYALANKFPKTELYGLTSQVKRSVVSIPSNIAEGYSRQYNKELKQFLYISLGSCAELETQLRIAQELKFISKENEMMIKENLSEIGKMLNGLIKKVKT